MRQRGRREREFAKVRPGDGKPLPAYRPWDVLGRSLFTIDHVEPNGESNEFAIDVRFFDFDDKAELYRNGKQYAVSSMPATFPVPGGAIEVAATMFGMKRVHLVLNSGGERQLRPAPRTAEYWRAWLDHQHPRLSRWMSNVAIVVLIVGLGLTALLVLEQVCQIPAVADRFGTFTSPIALPGWLNTTLLVAGALAALERALMLRNHWLIDADTWWLSV